MTEFAFQAMGLDVQLPVPLLDVATDDLPAGLMARRAHTFAFAAGLLPAERRAATESLYAFFRTLDDLVDEPRPATSRGSRAAELAAWRAWLGQSSGLAAPRPALGRELRDVQATYQIPTGYFLDFLDGLEFDLDGRELGSFRELHGYCIRVASSAGGALAYVLGATMPPALSAAEDLGVAMQLTNILRDVGEDLALGRVYLPSDELARFGSSREHLRRLWERGDGPDARWRALMAFQVRRAQAFYRRGLAGVGLLPPEHRLPILVAGNLYQRILTKLEQHAFDSLRERVATSRDEKLQELAVASALEHVGTPVQRDGIETD